jgi:hypothetical protein
MCPVRCVTYVSGRSLRRRATQLGFSKLAPHDLRRSCARLCYSAGCELEQIQCLLGHVSAQTTVYMGCKQRLSEAVNDRIGIEPSTQREPLGKCPISLNRSSPTQNLKLVIISMV